MSPGHKQPQSGAAAAGLGDKGAAGGATTQASTQLTQTLHLYSFLCCHAAAAGMGDDGAAGGAAAVPVLQAHHARGAHLQSGEHGAERRRLAAGGGGRGPRWSGRQHPQRIAAK